MLKPSREALRFFAEPGMTRRGSMNKEHKRTGERFDTRCFMLYNSVEQSELSIRNDDRQNHLSIQNPRETR